MQTRTGTIFDKNLIGTLQTHRNNGITLRGNVCRASERTVFDCNVVRIVIRFNRLNKVMRNLICRKLKVLDCQCAGSILSGARGDIDAAGHCLLITINNETDVFCLRKRNRFRTRNQKRNRIAVLNRIDCCLKR